METDMAFALGRIGEMWKPEVEAAPKERGEAMLIKLQSPLSYLEESVTRHPGWGIRISRRKHSCASRHRCSTCCST